MTYEKNEQRWNSQENMTEIRNRKGILMIVSAVIVILLIIISGRYLFLHNKSYKN